MNKAEFLQALESELASVTQDERQAALDYYKEYFDDAGAENEHTVIAELGSVAKLAGTIKANCGTVPEPLRTADEVKHNVVNNSQAPSNASRTLLLVIIAIVTFPLWIGIVCGLGGVLIGVLAVVLSMVLVGVVLAICGIILFFAGLPLLAGLPGNALLIMGTGLLLAGIGVLITAAMCFVLGKGLPLIGKGVGKLFKAIFGQREAKKS